MDNEPPGRRARLMGKLLRRDRKISQASELAAENENVEDFLLHGSSDKLAVSHAAPRMLKLDTSGTTRYPQALALNVDVGSSFQQSFPVRTKNAKGLSVRFSEDRPRVVGEGGDECEIPICEMTKRNAAWLASIPQGTPRTGIQQTPAPQESAAQRVEGQLPLWGTPTGGLPPFDISKQSVEGLPPEKAQPGNSNVLRLGTDANGLSDEKRKSFLEMQQVQQRQAEGIAFVKAARLSGSTNAVSNGEASEPEPLSAVSSKGGNDEAREQASDRPVDTLQRVRTNETTSSSVSHGASPRAPSIDKWAPNIRNDHSPISPVRTERSMSQGELIAGEGALGTFRTRSRHLVELFRLHAERIRSLSASSPDDLARAALWFFLKGRISLEHSIRHRQTDENDRERHEAVKQQAFADLTKACWLCEEILPVNLSDHRVSPDADSSVTQQAILLALRKLCISMERNGYLPSEEASLTQQINKEIWVEYPVVTRGLADLLRGPWLVDRSGSDQKARSMTLQQAMPIGDTQDAFCYGRYAVQAYVVEQGASERRFCFPCLLSASRPVQQTGLSFVIASQNGVIQFRIHDEGEAKPTWQDVKWHAGANTLDIRLSWGLSLALQCEVQDFKHLWSMHDFSSQAHAIMQPREDERLAFQTRVKNFQYFDANPESKTFPKESKPNCDIALLERLSEEPGPHGIRKIHRGFRLAVLTAPETKMLSAVNHNYVPYIPVQFGFLRDEHNNPALLLKFDDGRATGRMVASFTDEKERIRLHSLITGIVLREDESIAADIALSSLSLSDSLDTHPSTFSRLPWMKIRVIRSSSTSQVRMVADFKNGLVNDRISLRPGELKIRTSVKSSKTIAVLRPPQRDMSIALSEAQVPKELVEEMFQILQLAKRTQTVRMYSFASLKELHDFETALTGFEVLFDEIASNFEITRRRMMISTQKKWEAGPTRVQVVRRGSVIQVLAFFEDFEYAESMSFAVRAIDVIEVIERVGKCGIRFADAKFPLPGKRSNDDGFSLNDPAFVALDVPELANEHDDLFLLFDNALDRDALARCLPAQMKGSRLSRRLD